MTLRFLSARRADLIEWMDRSDCDPVKLHNTYRYFPVINRLISRWDAVYRRYLRPLLRTGHHVHLLDVGSGGGDITGNIHAWAARDGLRLAVTGIDPDPRAHKYALDRLRRRKKDDAANGTPSDSDPPGGDMAGSGNSPTGNSGTPPPLAFLQADTRELRREGRTFDFVTCNHVLHHLKTEEIPGFLDDLASLATRRAICSDIERSAIGYLLFSVATWPLFPNSFIRADGLISIRKSFRVDELRAILPPGWRVKRQFPFRLLLIFDHHHAVNGEDI